MRKSILLAAIGVTGLVAGKWAATGNAPSIRVPIAGIMLFGGLSFLAQFESLATLVDAFSYTILLLILLNDGPEVLNAFTSL